LVAAVATYVAWNYVDSSTSLGADGSWTGYYLTFSSGTIAGETRRITASTSNRLSFSPNLSDAPGAGSRFRITRYALPHSLAEGYAQDGSTTTDIIARGLPGWADDVWKGCLVTFTAGTNNGLTRTVTANGSGNTLTISPALPVAPDGASKFRITSPAGTVREARVGDFNTSSRQILAEYLANLNNQYDPTEYNSTYRDSPVTTWAANQWAGCFLIMLDGLAAGKAYLIESNDTGGWITLSDGGITGSVDLNNDRIAKGNRFFIAGHRTSDPVYFYPRTLPHDRLGLPLATGSYLLNPGSVPGLTRQTGMSPISADPGNPIYNAAGVARYGERGKDFPLLPDYSYALIISDQAGELKPAPNEGRSGEPGRTELGVRVDALVYYNFNETRPPAGNRPPVARYVYEERIP
jgi:hypothetical protein